MFAFCMPKRVCMFYALKLRLCVAARSSAGGPGEAAGQAAAAVGEEVRPSPHGRLPVGRLMLHTCCMLVMLVWGFSNKPTCCAPLPLSQCDVGEQCAVRKGARIGKMCDCPRGAFCNFYLLKCL